MQKIADQVSGTVHLQEQVAELLKGSNDPRVNWTTWMDSEVKDIPDHLWQQFQTESINMIHRYKNQSRGTPFPPPMPPYQWPQQQQQQQQTQHEFNISSFLGGMSGPSTPQQSTPVNDPAVTGQLVVSSQAVLADPLAGSSTT